jgi:hypothetical protein
MKAIREGVRWTASGKRRTAGRERRERQQEATAGSLSWPSARGRHRNVKAQMHGGRSTRRRDRDGGGALAGGIGEQKGEGRELSVEKTGRWGLASRVRDVQVSSTSAAVC